MSKARQIGQAMMVLGAAVAILWGGCTYVPFSLEGIGCTEAVLTSFSDRYGCSIIEEVNGFQGTLTKKDLNTKTWILEGEFAFPTGGYSVLEPEAAVRETWPEQVEITIYVRTPKLLSFVCSTPAQVPVSAKITAEANAQFTVKVCSRPESRCGCFE